MGPVTFWNLWASSLVKILPLSLVEDMPAQYVIRFLCRLVER